MSTAGLIWIIAAVVFGIIEAATVTLVTVWFAVGAVAAAIAAQCGLAVIWQVGIFVIVSGVLLCLTRPLFKKFMVKKPQRTNADRFIGREGVVISLIDKINNTGQVKVSGMIWSAVSYDGEDIAENTSVEVMDIKGVKLVVRALQPNKE